MMKRPGSQDNGLTDHSLRSAQKVHVSEMFANILAAQMMMRANGEGRLGPETRASIIQFFADNRLEHSIFLQKILNVRVSTENKIVYLLHSCILDDALFCQSWKRK